MTNSQCQFGSPLPYGDYTIAEQHPLFEQSCPGTVTISTPAEQTLNMGCTGGQALDVMLLAASGAARPGFELAYGISIDNLTSAATGIVTVTLEVDALLSFLYSGTTPASVAGNVLTWTSPGFTLTQPFQHRNLSPRFLVPNDPGLIGATLTATATITTANADGDLTNNTFTTSIIVTGSFDPNDKVGTISSRSSATHYLIDEDEWIDYTIRFQNTGTDTAFSVLITDTLEVPLDPGSVQMGASSHDYTWSMDLNGALRVSFANILLPDSNVNESASHGFVMLRIKPILPLVPGTLIENTANIFFDFNPSVITDPSLLVAEFSTGQAEGPGDVEKQLILFPNPATDELQVIIGDAGVGAHTADVLSMDGRLVMHIGAISSNSKISTASLAAGAYVLRLRDAEGRTQQASFMKR